ncbi:MAG: TAXI family TRAP transporter solute-binding subunit [Gammaproteobacteria bacterium]|nr:TAXI family TRAP transporter solute-binding subunit [Gammaproteobacteria bacterium]
MSTSTIKAIVLPVFVTLVAFFLAYQFVDPAPPNQIVFTTGKAGGAYDKFAHQYQKALGKQGVELVLQNSKGSVENISRLESGSAAAGFIQGGTGSAETDSRLLTLGSLYNEPLWVFHRKETPVSTLFDFKGNKLIVGAEGSGTRALVMQLLVGNGLQDQVELHPGKNGDDLVALKSGQVDAVFMVASATSEKVRAFLEDESIALMHFDRAEAYQRRMKYLTHVNLPRGMVDLSKDIPGKDITLLAATANLMVRDDLHPAIQDLLLQVAEEIHGKGGWFEKNGEFPNANFPEYPVSPEAKRYYKYGPPLLQRYLPFWLASLIDRLKVMILPLVVLMIPLMKVMPPIYTWRMRSKIYRWYQALEQIDLANSRENPDLEDLRNQLEKIDQEVIHVQVPLSFASQLYDLRQHIELVKRRLS